MPKPLIPISSKQAILFACFLVMYEFLTYIANDMIMPGMLHVVHSFQAPESMVATSLTVYMLGGASLQIILGPLSDSFGRRPMMLIGAFLFALFSIFIASSHSMHQFMVARFFQGMGLCFIGVIGYATIQEIFEEMDAIRIIAIMANAAIVAPLLGPLIGAIIIHYTSWRYIFISIAIGAFFAFWGLWRYMPESSVKHPFSLQSVVNNYLILLKNKTFVFSALAIGFVGIPCLAWIALAPLILIKEAHLSVIDYALWQIPVFGSTILGNWFLHRLSYRFKMEKLILIGCLIMFIAAILQSLLPFLLGNHYLHLMPGIILYFFSLSIINAPLNRFCLYVTSVTKGTASALISLSVMVIGALGTEASNISYQDHSNMHFGLFCNAMQIIFFIWIGLAFWSKKANPKKGTKKKKA